MTITTIAGHDVDVNEEGFLTHPAQWDEALAPELARLIGIETHRRALDSHPLPA